MTDRPKRRHLGSKRGRTRVAKYDKPISLPEPVEFVDGLKRLLHVPKDEEAKDDENRA